jgi:sigma-B regulation protein RsbU (phosphoserine phosphatase)
MIDERDKQLADLQTVLAVSRDLVAATELTPLLERIQIAALTVLGCERATVFLYDREANELYSRVATGVDEIRLSADQGIAGEVARTGKVVHVDDAYTDGRFNREIDRRTGFRTRNMIAFPLVGFDDTIVGVLQVLNKKSGTFDAWDRRLVETLGAQIGVVVQRQLLLEQYAEKQRIQADLNIARSIQQALLPKQAPEIPGFDIAGWNQPADETGGDCYDFYMLEDGSAAVTIADATGHGVGPALMIAECRALFRATILLSRDLAHVAGLINNLLCDDLPSDRFVTAFFGIVSASGGSIKFLSAGQGPLIKYVRRTDEFTELKADMFPLGIMRDQTFAAPDEFVMEPGDMMVLVTDGFAEWTDARREQFGIQRVCQVIREHRDDRSAEIIKRLHEAVVSFAGGTHQADDLTAVIVKRL